MPHGTTTYQNQDQYPDTVQTETVIPPSQRDFVPQPVADMTSAALSELEAVMQDGKVTREEYGTVRNAHQKLNDADEAADFDTHNLAPDLHARLIKADINLKNMLNGGQVEAFFWKFWNWGTVSSASDELHDLVKELSGDGDD